MILMLANTASDAGKKNDAADGADGDAGDGSTTEGAAAAAPTATAIATIVRIATTTGGGNGTVPSQTRASKHAVLVILRAVRVGAADAPNDGVGETCGPAALITRILPEEATA